MSRPALNGKAMSAAERQARRRARLRGTMSQVSSSLDTDHATGPLARSCPESDLLSLDVEVIARRIIAAMPPEKATQVAVAINQQLVHWRVGGHPILNRSGHVSSYCADPAAAAGLPRTANQALAEARVTGTLD